MKKKTKASLGALGIVSVVLSLTSAKAHGQEPESCVVGPTQAPCDYIPPSTVPPLPAMKCADGEIWSSVPPVGCYPNPYNAPVFTLPTQPPVVVSIATPTTLEVDVCGDYGDKAACAALVQAKFGPPATTKQRTTHSPVKAKPRATTTTVHTWTYDERFAFVQAFIAPLFYSMVP